MKHIIRNLFAIAMAVALVFGCALAKEESDVESLFQQGLSAYNKNNYAEALEKFASAAEAGYAPAQCYLGILYFDGSGVEKDDAKGVEWWTKAAEQGDALAQSNLGFAYLEGFGVRQNRAQAARWYMKSAEGDEAYLNAALNSLEKMAEDPRLDPDCAQVAGWFVRAERQGDPEAQYNLAMAYMNGVFVDRDDALARKWFERAAEGENVMAQAALAAMYAEGRGVEADAGKAMEWIARAESNGYPDAAALRARVEGGAGAPGSEAPDGAEEAPDFEGAAETEAAEDSEDAALFSEDEEPDAAGEAGEEIVDQAAVRVAQEELNKLGYACGTPDGIAGSRTREAVAQFQRDNGLAETGKLDAATVAKLTEIIREAKGS